MYSVKFIITIIAICVPLFYKIADILPAVQTYILQGMYICDFWISLCNWF